MKSKLQKFEKNYFNGWFKQAVGDFSEQDLIKSQNWFNGWLKEIDKKIDIHQGNGRSILEIGCSIGGMSSLLAGRGFKIYASDISEYAISRARKLRPDINFLTFDVQKKIPLKEKFDFVFSFEVVEHLSNPLQAIKNMKNVLKTNGMLVLSTPFPYPWMNSDPTHINVHYPFEWVAFLRQAGFTYVRYNQFSLLPYFYRFHKDFHLSLPFGIPNKHINSPIFYFASNYAA